LLACLLASRGLLACLLCVPGWLAPLCFALRCFALHCVALLRVALLGLAVLCPALPCARLAPIVIPTCFGWPASLKHSDPGRCGGAPHHSASGPGHGSGLPAPSR
jgi:hypothetical protein